MGTERLDDGGVDLLDEEQEMILEPPPLYKVVLLNDDYTPMEFVIQILKTIFRLDHPAANQVMLDIHQHGKGTGGVYTHEIAETKQAQIQIAAQKAGHPLQAVLERA